MISPLEKRYNELMKAWEPVRNYHRKHNPKVFRKIEEKLKYLKAIIDDPNAVTEKWAIKEEGDEKPRVFPNG